MVLAEGIVVRASEKGGGKTLIATQPIRAGAMVWEEDLEAEAHYSSIPRTWAWIQSLPADAREIYCHFMYKTGPDSHESLAEFDTLPPEQWHTVESRDPSMYMNHACEPTCWFEFPGGVLTQQPTLMTATRDIQPGDEITFDYATSEEHDQSWTCLCGSALCRGKIAGDDWKRPELQQRYNGHFLKHIQDKIDAAAAAAAAAAGQQ